MSTLLQKKLANAIVENSVAEKPLNKQQLTVLVGYAINTADDKAGEIMDSKGVREELKVLGFNEYSAKNVVSEIMLNPDVDPSARLKATDQVFKVKGSYAPEKSTALNLNVEARNSANPELESIRQEFIEKLKTKLSC